MVNAVVESRPKCARHMRACLLAVTSALLSHGSGAQESALSRGMPNDIPPAIRSFYVNPDAIVVNPATGSGDASVLLRELRSRKKGEFETTFSYLARQPKIADGAHYFALRILNVGSGACVPSAEYDADAERFAFKLTTSNLFVMDEKEIASVLVARCSSSPQGSYVGVNGFGTKKIIQKVHHTVVGVAATEHDIPDTTVTVSVPANEAKALKPNLRLLIVFAPEPRASGTLVSIDSDRDEPKMDYPYDRTTDFSLIWARFVSIWVIDSRSGKVLEKREFCPSTFSGNAKTAACP